MNTPGFGNTIAALALAVLAAAPAHAGPAGDALSRCISTSLTKSDRTMLAKWMFVAMSAYPEARRLASIPDAQMDSLNRSTAALFKGLIGKTCNDKAVAAIQTEGNKAVEESFKLLPQLGVREMLENPGVAQQMQGLQKYMEDKK